MLMDLRTELTRRVKRRLFAPASLDPVRVEAAAKAVARKPGAATPAAAPAIPCPVEMASISGSATAIILVGVLVAFLVFVIAIGALGFDRRPKASTH